MDGYPAGMPPEHPYRALDVQIARLLWTPQLPGSAYFYGTVVLDAHIDQDYVGGGSGFVIQVGALPPEGRPDFFLIAARHVVLEAQAKGATIDAQIVRSYEPNRPVQERFPLTLPNDGWIHNEDSDVSILPFPVVNLPEDHNLMAIPQTELASRKKGVLLHQGAELKIYGRWSVQQGAGIPIVRTVYLATFERPTAPLSIAGARRRVEVYLADGTVSAGMSGGPAAYLGGGWANSAILGLIHGYWPLGEADLAAPDAVGEHHDRAQVVQEVRRELGAVNSGIFFIVPIQHVEPLLERVGYGFVRAPV